ncbi:MAG TPA: hypothetical protein VEH27_08180 [Methylomirabilota bacterium]|nr:hypothetical protein [Methylomirabilota bacterium]
MRTRKISVAEAARNFVDCVNRAHDENVTYVLLKDGSPVARLVPEQEKVCGGQVLADILAKVKLPPEEAEAWQRDLQAARKMLKPPVDKWG